MARDSKDPRRVIIRASSRGCLGVSARSEFLLSLDFLPSLPCLVIPSVLTTCSPLSLRMPHADNSLPAPVSVSSPYERRAFEAYKTPNHRCLLVRPLEYKKGLPPSNSVAYTPSANSHSATRPKSFFLGRRKTRQDVAGVFYDAQLDHANALLRSSTNYAGHRRPPCPHPPRRSKPEECG